MMRLVSLLKRVSMLCACMVALSPAMIAQYNGGLQGTITDPDGAVIPDATVTLTNKETNGVLTTTSRSGGEYNFNGLPPSSYNLTISRTGFKQKEIDNIKIIAEQANSLNVQMEVGGSSEVVNVNAEERPLIDTATQFRVPSMA